MSDLENDKDSITPLPVIPTAVGSPSVPLVAVPVLHDEEYATELAEPMAQLSHFDGIAKPISRTWGWSAFVVSIISLFIMPVTIGSAGVVLGIIAFFRGNRVLGGWSIAISLISIFTSLVLVPNYA
ncbi:DUF4190 domain-containing protein [Paenibacillus psychroresistens]|uniref:DUF4190 domain-containing protein n=1 Tax=Paenibacillus psychroresistens TaxID=1778678 RepID=A0A6B8RGZ8_9BACL|nr:DUF4190 domain-containing protein [Paenibacillus psychroresistens]QGQ95741.1 DUF4190 domain-containing protein [Paenibacillus psychroresistens]